MDLVMPPMPFSAVAAPIGAAYLVVPEEMRNTASSTEIALPPGVVQVIVTWQGAEPLSVRHYRGEQMEVVHQIPSAASGVQRSTGVLTLASDEAHHLRIAHSSARGDRWEQLTLDRGYVAGIQVMPMGTAADITGGGSLLRVDDSVGTRVFLGDQMIFGDTGWRRLSDADFINGWGAGSVRPSIRRLNDMVMMDIPSLGFTGVDATSQRFMKLPNGLKPAYNYGVAGFLLGSGEPAPAHFDLGGHLYMRVTPYDRTFTGQLQWRASGSTSGWPTTLPGTA